MTSRGKFPERFLPGDDVTDVNEWLDLGNGKRGIIVGVSDDQQLIIVL